MHTVVLDVFPYLLGFVIQPVAIQQLQQPIGTVSSTTVVKQSSGDHYKTLSVVMTILVFILGGWPSVMCTMAALMISYNVIVDPNVQVIIHVHLCSHFFFRQGVKKDVATLQ